VDQLNQDSNVYIKSNHGNVIIDRKLDKEIAAGLANPRQTVLSANAAARATRQVDRLLKMPNVKPSFVVTARAAYAQLRGPDGALICRANAKLRGVSSPARVRQTKGETLRSSRNSQYRAQRACLKALPLGDLRSRFEAEAKEANSRLAEAGNAVHRANLAADKEKTELRALRIDLRRLDSKAATLAIGDGANAAILQKEKAIEVQKQAVEAAERARDKADLAERQAEQRRAELQKELEAKAREHQLQKEEEERRQEEERQKEEERQEEERQREEERQEEERQKEEERQEELDIY
jgi:hypothetical protein